MTVLIWQDGFGSELLFGQPATGVITTWVPIAAFAFLFGLSMDYEVFILSRMREAYDEHGDTDRAVGRRHLAHRPAGHLGRTHPVPRLRRTVHRAVGRGEDPGDDAGARHRDRRGHRPGPARAGARGRPRAPELDDSGPLGSCAPHPLVPRLGRRLARMYVFTCQVGARLAKCRPRPGHSCGGPVARGSPPGRETTRVALTTLSAAPGAAELPERPPVRVGSTGQGRVRHVLPRRQHGSEHARQGRQEGRQVNRRRRGRAGRREAGRAGRGRPCPGSPGSGTPTVAEPTKPREPLPPKPDQAGPETPYGDRRGDRRRPGRRRRSRVAS